MTSRYQFKNELGFTMIELLLVLSLVAIVSVVSISVVGNSIDEARFNDTTSKMQQIKAAVIGNVEQREGATRSSFGYLGDIGAIPTGAIGLSGLTTKPGGAASWSVNTTVRFGLGWNGPYITSSFSANPLVDGWGNAFVYNASATPPTITSLGSDGVAGGTGYKQDIVLTLPTEFITAKVYGFISEAGGPYNGSATVEINYPNGAGAVQTSSVNLVAADKGYFQFTNIPLGKRSVTTYVPNKTSPTKTIGPVLVSIDQSNYLVPTNLIDTNPGGTGTGTGTGTGSGANCTTNAGYASYVPGTGSIGTTTISFTVKFNSSVTISSISHTANENRNLDRLNMNGNSYRCSGSSLILNTCPLTDSQLSTISPTYVTGTGNFPFIARFQGQVRAESNLKLTIIHDKGCDVINVDDL